MHRELNKRHKVDLRARIARVYSTAKPYRLPKWISELCKPQLKLEVTPIDGDRSRSFGTGTGVSFEARQLSNLRWFFDATEVSSQANGTGQGITFKRFVSLLNSRGLDVVDIRTLESGSRLFWCASSGTKIFLCILWAIRRESPFFAVTFTTPCPREFDCQELNRLNETYSFLKFYRDEDVPAAGVLVEYDALLADLPDRAIGNLIDVWILNMTRFVEKESPYDHAYAEFVRFVPLTALGPEGGPKRPGDGEIEKPLCWNCGKRLEPYQNVCPSCGKKQVP